MNYVLKIHEKINRVLATTSGNDERKLSLISRVKFRVKFQRPLQIRTGKNIKNIAQRRT